jgi:hypothetical protein
MLTYADVEVPAVCEGLSVVFAVNLWVVMLTYADVC